MTLSLIGEPLGEHDRASAKALFARTGIPVCLLGCSVGHPVQVVKLARTACRAKGWSAVLGPAFPAEEVRASGTAAGCRMQRPSRRQDKVLERVSAVGVEVVWPGERGSQWRVLLDAAEQSV